MSYLHVLAVSAESVESRVTYCNKHNHSPFLQVRFLEPKRISIKTFCSFRLTQSVSLGINPRRIMSHILVYRRINSLKSGIVDIGNFDF